VLTVSATEVHKNHAGAIEAVRLARAASGADLRLQIVGPAGRAEPEVTRRVHAADPSGAWITRHVDVTQARLDALYREAWALLHPSLDEGFGLPLLEAAGHALPAVHSGRGAMPEVISTGNVLTVEPDALAAGLVDLLDSGTYRNRSESVLSEARAHGLDHFRADLLRLVTATVSGGR
jgi:glycosyltransferase involved in cell wall biosynthesis